MRSHFYSTRDEDPTISLLKLYAGCDVLNTLGIQTMKKIGSGSHGHVYESECGAIKHIPLPETPRSSFMLSDNGFRTLSLRFIRVFYELRVLLHIQQHIPKDLPGGYTLLRIKGIVPPLSKAMLFRHGIFVILERHQTCLSRFLRTRRTANQLSLSAPQSEETTRSIMRDVLSALSLLHSAGILHLDCKPANLLCDPARCTDGLLNAITCDYGLACPQDSVLCTESPYVVTCWYRSPEVCENIIRDKRAARASLFAREDPQLLKATAPLAWPVTPGFIAVGKAVRVLQARKENRGTSSGVQGMPYGKGADTWAAGCILAELIYGVPLFQHVKTDELQRRQTDYFRDEELMHQRYERYYLRGTAVSEPAKELLFGLLKREPGERWTAKQALRHRFLAENSLRFNDGEPVCSELMIPQLQEPRWVAKVLARPSLASIEIIKKEIFRVVCPKEWAQE